MICTFSNFAQLSQGVEMIQQQLGPQTKKEFNDVQSNAVNESNISVNEYQIMHLVHENEELNYDHTYDQVTDNPSGFYTIFSKKKIDSTHDQRSKVDLQKLFHQVDSSLIQKVWTNQHNWTACFSVLQSIVASHKSISGCVLMEECEFLCDETWPALPLAGQKTTLDGWSVLSINDISNLSILDTSKADTIVSEGWEMIDDDAEHHVLSQTETNQPQIPCKISYKDMLQRNLSTIQNKMDNEIHQLHSKKIQTIPYQPNLVVERIQKNQHVDKVYLNNYFLGKEFANEDTDMNTEEEATKEFYSSVMYLKRSVSSTRYRKNTRLPPAIMEKKLERISQKTN